MPTISARLSEEDLEELERVADLLDDDRSTTIRKALEEGLAELRVREAVGRYQQGDVAVTEAARIAGLSVAEWLRIARERNLTTQLTAADLRRDADSARELGRGSTSTRRRWSPSARSASSACSAPSTDPWCSRTLCVPR